MTTWFFKFIIIMTIIQLLMIPIIMKNFHPLNMMILLITIITMTLLFNYMNLNKTMYSLMIFISMIGGIMIMFMYFTSLINNYKIKLNKKEKLIIMLMIIFNFSILIIMYNLNFKIIEEELIMKYMNIHLIYTYPYNMLTYLSIIYLFYCLTMIMKMCSLKMKPLRKMKN